MSGLHLRIYCDSEGRIKIDMPKGISICGFAWAVIFDRALPDKDLIQVSVVKRLLHSNFQLILAEISKIFVLQ